MEGGGPSNRTRAHLKRKAEQALANIQEIKKIALNMNKLEQEATKILRNLA